MNWLGPIPLKRIVLGFIIILGLFGVLVIQMHGQLAAKNKEILALHQQINDLQSLIGPIRQGTWNMVTSFGGMSGMITDHFYVAGSDLRLNWTYFSSESPPDFAVYVYQEGDLIEVDAFHHLSEQGTVFLRMVDTGQYYLDIKAKKIDQWSITVEQWISE